MSHQNQFEYSFIATGDVHIGWKLYNLPELRDDGRTLFERAVNKAIEKEVKFFIVAGDLYDVQNPTEEDVRFVSDQVNRLRAHGIYPIGISGDHDKRPGVDTTWINDVNGFDTSLDPIFGLNYKNFLDVPGVLNSLPNAQSIEWIVLHGQEETLFPYIDEKKRLNLKGVDFSRFPNLRGFILGDIHTPMEGFIEVPELKRRIQVWYTGSLNVIRSNEIGEDKGILYFDGEKITREKVEPTRTYARFDLPQDAHLIPKFVEDIKNEKAKPLIVVNYVEDITKEQRDSLNAFEGVAFLKTNKVRHNRGEESVNIRSELRTSNNVESVAALLIEDEQIRKLFVELVQAIDFKTLLDAYKKEVLDG